MSVIPFTFIEDKHSVLIYIIVTFLKCVSIIYLKMNRVSKIIGW